MFLDQSFAMFWGRPVNHRATAIVILVLSACVLQVVTGATTSSKKPKLAEGRAGQNCTGHREIIDKCCSLATYSYTTASNPYPNNSSDFKASCDRILEGLKCLKVHGKCLSQVARRSLNSYSGARTRHSKRLCANADDQKSVDFIKSAECIRKSNKREKMVTRERDLIGTIQMLADNVTMKWEDRFHNACCAASFYRNQVLKELEPECGKFKEAQEEMVNSMVGELLETACPDGNRLRDICPKLAKLEQVSANWKAVSLTGAALNLIIALADNPH